MLQQVKPMQHITVLLQEYLQIYMFLQTCTLFKSVKFAEKLQLMQKKVQVKTR